MHLVFRVQLRYAIVGEEIGEFEAISVSEDACQKGIRRLSVTAGIETRRRDKPRKGDVALVRIPFGHTGSEGCMIMAVS